jgi:hypothetical protein
MRESFDLFGFRLSCSSQTEQHQSTFLPPACGFETIVPCDASNVEQREKEQEETATTGWCQW